MGESSGDVRFVGASDGVRLQYEAVGDGENVTFLHGGFTSRKVFSKQKAALADRWRLILTDLRGHGGTEQRLPADFGLDTSEVDDLCRVLDAEGVDRTHLVGHSTGGAIAFAFARRFPDRVGRMVLLEPSLMSLLDPETYGAKKAEVERIAAATAEGPEAVVRGMFAFVLGDGWTALPPEVQDAQVAALVPLAAIMPAHAMTLFDLRVTDDDVRALAAPTLLVYGTASMDFEAVISARFRELRPDIAQLHVEGAGHNIHRDAPGVVTEAIAEFLSVREPVG